MQMAASEKDWRHDAYLHEIILDHGEVAPDECCHLSATAMGSQLCCSFQWVSIWVLQFERLHPTISVMPTSFDPVEDT